MSKEDVQRYIDEANKVIDCKIALEDEKKIQEMLDKMQPLWDNMDDEEKMYVGETVLRLEIWKVAVKNNSTL